jgi:hypothetical protein
MCLTKDRFEKVPEYVAFFADLEKGDDSRNWFKCVLREVSAMKFEEAMGKGESVTAQATPIYTEHRRAIAHSLLKHNTRESIKRNSVIQVLGMSAGRPSEVATISTDVITWDPLFECAVARWAQAKTHKFKIVVLCAGKDYGVCSITGLGLAHASGCFGNQIYHQADLNLMFPELAETSHPATVVTNYLKALAADSDNKTYSLSRVPSLPLSPTAGGFRVGASNEMACNGISAELSIAVTGHDAEWLSCLWHYINADLPTVVPGASVLAGWRNSQRYGQLGPGPKPANLIALVDMGITEFARLEELADRVLILRDGISPPSMLRGGHLRGLVFSMLASILMHYKDL